MTSNCAGSPSPTAPGRAERSTSRVTRKSFSHRRPRTRCIRRSAISLFRPRSSAQQQAILCTRRPRSLDEHAPWMFHLMAVHGADIGEVSYETDRMRFIGRGNTVADPQAMRGLRGALGQRGLRARSDCRDPVSDHARSGRIGDDQYCLRRRRNPRRMPWALSRNTRIGVSRIASSIWRGRTARWSCGSSMPRRPTRNSMDAWPAPSSTPIPRCAPTRAFSARTAAGNPVSGATPFPAICRSCCCRSETRPISIWCANSSRPTRTGA